MSKERGELRVDFKLLDKFIEGWNIAEQFSVKVGILGAKASRSNKDNPKGMTNADVGAVHEWGSYSRKVPKRSFLRMPITEKAQEIIQGVKDNGALLLLAGGNIIQLLVNLGVMCESMIALAFNTMGFGKWKPLKKRTIKYKIGKNPKPLWNTAQLMKAVTSKVDKR